MEYRREVNYTSPRSDLMSQRREYINSDALRASSEQIDKAGVSPLSVTDSSFDEKPRTQPTRIIGI